MTDDVEAAWDALYESLPAGWHIGRPSYDPARHAWSVTAWGPRRGRDKAPQSVSGIGEDEGAALRDLDDRLRRARKPDSGLMDELRRQLKLAYIEGAEAWSREQSGRSLTGDELERVLMHFQPRS
jgi:hypothetical protein